MNKKYIFFTINNFEKDDGGTIRMRGIVNALARKGDSIILISNSRLSSKFESNIHHIFLNSYLSKQKKQIFQVLVAILPSLFYKYIFKDFFLKINSLFNLYNITIPINGGVGFDNLDISELWMVDILKSLDIERGVFIDIGVNIGQTLIKVKSIYDEIEYIGFEPNSLCVSYVNRLIEINRWRDITIVPVGIMQESSILSLDYYSDSNTDSSASLVPNYRKNSKIYKRETIATFSIDRVKHLWKDRDISVIKIDVEGAEKDVILSLKDIIKKDRPILLVEILPVYEKSNTERLNNQIEIENIMSELNYTIYRVEKRVDNSFESFKEIKSIGIHDNLKWCDYIFSPNKII